MRAAGDEILRGSKHLWLYSKENLLEVQQDRFDELRGPHLKTARAWAMTESLRDLWSYRRRSWAMRHCKCRCFRATHPCLQPVIDAESAIKRNPHNVITYFAHRITNSVSDGLNSKIQTIERTVYGFRNRDYFRTAIYFHCGGPELCPATRGIPG